MLNKRVARALAIAFASAAACAAHAGPYVVMVAKPTLKVSAPATTTPPSDQPGSDTGGIPVDPLGNSPTPVENVPLLTGSLSSSTIAVGGVSYGTSATRSVVFTNTGESPLTFSALPYLAAGTSEDFRTSTTCAATLAPQASCLANVTFQPLNIGAANGTLVFPTDALNGPHDVALSGTGVGSRFALFQNGAEVTALAPMSNVPVNTTSAPATFTVQNTGNLAGTPTLSVSPSQFTVTGCGTSLSPGASCTASVTFKPIARGDIPGDVRVAGATGLSAAAIPVIGTGVSAHYDTFVNGIAAKALPAFTGVQIGSTSAAASFTVKNTGNIAGTPAPSSGASQFSVAGCAGSLAPGASCTVNVTFTPSSAIEVDNSITLAATADAPATNVDVSGTGSAVNASNWHLTASLGRDNWYGMAFGAGRFIAVGSAGKVQTSTDGMQWSSPSTIAGWNGGSMRWTSYQGGLFLTVGQTQIGYSSDGFNWGTTPIAYGAWNGFAYGNGVYVAVDASSAGLTAYSSTGTSGWTTKTNGGRWTQVAFGAGKFIANSFVASSKLGVTTDGVNWTTINNPLTGANNGGINYVNGRFILVQGAQFATSTDGTNWTTGSLPVDFNNGYPYIAYGGGSYVILGAGTRLVTSTDGLNWTASTPPNQSWSGIAYGNGRFAASTYNGYYMGYTQ